MGELADRILRGDLRAASRLMRQVEDGSDQATPELQALFPKTGKAYVVGLTGPPGAGKSTLTDGLIRHYRREGLSVGVLAVDPTSPFTGGAILGDRVRMQDHALDPEVFIRSMATRGQLGGLSRATGDCVRVMDALGKAVVLVETVGVGQDEVEIAGLAHTTAVVLNPGVGDDVQAIKAGILEVADLFVVNKADREGVDRTVKELRSTLELRRVVHGPPKPGMDDWEPPIVRTQALTGQGLEELAKELARHRTHLETTGLRPERDRARARSQLVALLKDELTRGALTALRAELGSGDDLNALADAIAQRRRDPYAIARELSAKLSKPRQE